MGLAADLTALAELVAPSPADQEKAPAAGPRLCPRMVTTYSPRVHWPRPLRGTESDPRGHNRWCRLAGPWPEAPGPGVRSPAKSETTPPRGRYGLNGLTGSGRREIWRSLKLLEEHRSQLFFWTITLPDQALEEIAAGGGWSAFQDRVRKELVRLLLDRMGEALVVGVAEVQPKRLRNHGTYAPHLHVAFVGRRHGWSRWAFDHADLDRIIVSAAMTAGASSFEPKAAGNVAPVRASVCAYMAKYMTKGSQRVDVCLALMSLVPRQWWFRSTAMLRWVRKHVTPICLRFLSWVHEHRFPLEEARLIRHRQVEGLPPSAPVCWRVDWIGPEQLAQVLALYHEWQWDAEWRSIHALIHERPHSRQHSDEHQHV